MEIALAEGRMLRLVEALSPDEALTRVEKEKVAAFGTVSRLFLRPKPEDIVLTYQELRYEPLWHIRCWAHYIYDRSVTIACGRSAFPPKGTLALSPQIRASFVVRQALRDFLQPIQADVLHEEKVTMECIDLYFDVGVDAVDLLVPGGGIAIKLAKSAMTRYRKE